MGYEVQMEEWLNRHKGATLKEAWKAGYFQCTDNWCRKETFQKRFNRPMSVKDVIDTGETILGNIKDLIKKDNEDRLG